MSEQIQYNQEFSSLDPSRELPAVTTAPESAQNPNALSNKANRNANYLNQRIQDARSSNETGAQAA